MYRSARGGAGLLQGAIGFWLLLLLAFWLRAHLGIAGMRIHHPDAIFQTLEQSHRIVFGYGIVPWEYHEGIRWYGTPLLLTPPLFLAAALERGPELYIPLLRLFLAAYSLAPAVLFFQIVRSRFGAPSAAIASILPLFWWENLYFSTITLSDSLSAVPFACAAMLPFTFRPDGKGRIFAFAICCALTFAIRFHLAPALGVIFLFAWMQLTTADRKALLVASFLCVVALAALDLAFGQIPFQHVYLNFSRNIFDGVAAGFGVEPWYFYILSVWQRAGWSMLVALPVLILAAGRPWRLLLPALVVFVCFSFVAHKEYRFYYPATLLLTFSIAWSALEVSFALRPRLGDWCLPVLGAYVAAILFASLPRYEALFAEREDNMAAASLAAARRNDICGLGVEEAYVFATAGHSYFHRNVPLDGMRAERLLGGEWKRFNYVLATIAASAALSVRYTIEECWSQGRSETMCLLRRPGECLVPH